MPRLPPGAPPGVYFLHSYSARFCTATVQEIYCVPVCLCACVPVCLCACVPVTTKKPRSFRSQDPRLKVCVDTIASWAPSTQNAPVTTKKLPSFRSQGGVRRGAREQGRLGGKASWMRTAPDPAAGTAPPLEPPPLPRAYNVYSSLSHFVSFGKKCIPSPTCSPVDVHMDRCGP